MRRWLALVFLALIGIPVSALGRPELLAPAIAYGARDCGFCHALPTGGTGLGERGSWLVAERDRRGAAAIDVEWLEGRDRRVAEPADSAAVPRAATPPLLAATPLRDEDRTRPFDYSTMHGEWPAYAGGLRAQKYSPLDEIGPPELGQLGVAWVWEGEKPGLFARLNPWKTPDAFKATPLMVAGRVLVRTRYSMVVALDATTGKPLWSFDPGTRDAERPANFGYSTRGLAYHRGGDGDRVLLATGDGWLYALDAATGRPIASFGDKGRVDLSLGLRRKATPGLMNWSGPPALCGETLVLGSVVGDDSHSRSKAWKQNVPVGDVRGFDVRTGKERWVFVTVPQAGDFGNETWGEGSWKWAGNTNAWSSMSCDPKREHVYVPLSAPTNHFYGGMRRGDNLFSTSVVALDAKTGERVWHFQTVHHDIWDYDLPTAPVVVDLVVGGRAVEAVAQPAKTGFLFVLDRSTGKPLWPVEERPVPQRALPGEEPAKTQPFPTWPPPFELQGASEDDLIALTPELHRRAKELLAPNRLGPLFEPPSQEGTYAVPGIGGGANWAGAAFDPESRILYVPSRRLPFLLKARAGAGQGHNIQIDATVPLLDGLPPIKPPWSSLTAYALDRGDFAWQIPNGRGPVEHPSLRGLDLPDLGAVGVVPGLLVTKRLLFHGGQGRDQAMLYARDKTSGKLLWGHRVEGQAKGAPAAPISYRAGGKQFVVFATGGPREAGRLTAFRLR